MFMLNDSCPMFYTVHLYICSVLQCIVIKLFQRCELCPLKDGALKRTDGGGKTLFIKFYKGH